MFPFSIFSTIQKGAEKIDFFLSKYSIYEILLFLVDSFIYYKYFQLVYMGLLMSQAQSWCESRRFINLGPLSLDENIEYPRVARNDSRIHRILVVSWMYFVPCTLCIPCTAGE